VFRFLPIFSGFKPSVLLLSMSASWLSDASNYSSTQYTGGLVFSHKAETRGVRNLTKMSDIGSKNRTELASKLKKRNSVSAVWFSKNRLRRFWDSFSRCLIHSSSSNMTGSTVKVFLFMPYLCTSSSESFRLTISWTKSARNYVISSIIP